MCASLYFMVLTIIFYGLFHDIQAEVGGYSLFASLAELKSLWSEEIKTIDLIEKLSQRLSDPPNSLKQYVNHYIINLLLIRKVILI